MFGSGGQHLIDCLVVDNYTILTFSSSRSIHTVTTYNSFCFLTLFHIKSDDGTFDRTN